MSERVIAVEMVHAEVVHLTSLVEQFAELVEDAADQGTDGDAAVRRLVPDGYADADAAREYRSLTERELLGRRRSDAAIVLTSLSGVEPAAEGMDAVVVTLDDETAHAWLTTLAAIRLVLATRLRIVDEDDHDEDDPRFGIYDWLGYRLDALVRALDPS